MIRCSYLTNEALLQETSRYPTPSYSFFLLGKQDHSSFSSLSRLEKALVTTSGASHVGCGTDKAGREATLDPLRVILADGEGNGRLLFFGYGFGGY